MIPRSKLTTRDIYKLTGHELKIKTLLIFRHVMALYKLKV